MSVDKGAFCLHFVCTACTFCLYYLHFLSALSALLFALPALFVCTICTAASIVASCLYRLELSVQAVSCYGCAR